MTSHDAIQLLSNGLGSWFALCRWCRRPSPSHDSRDDLRVIAKAQAARWTVTRGEQYEVVCPLCVDLH
jgi:hypothetical protein